MNILQVSPHLDKSPFVEEISNNLTGLAHDVAIQNKVLDPKMVSGHYNIAHLHHYPTYLNLVFRCLPRHIPFVIQPHGSWGSYPFPERTKFYLIAGRWLMDHARRIIAVSEMEYRQLHEEWKKKTVIIPNAIEWSQYENLAGRRPRCKYWDSSSETLICYMGRLHPVKQVYELIAAFIRLLRVRRTIRLVIAGTDGGEYSGMCRSLASYSDRILFRPWITGAEKIEMLCSSDIFVLPSRYEIFGIVLLEAMACQLPIVTTAACGLASEIEKHKAGVVIDTGQRSIIDGLYDSMLSLIDDTGKRREMGANGRNLVIDKFTYERVIPMYEGVYREACASDEVKHAVAEA